MNHIAFIMDGNRSWAQDRGLPKFEGHRRGYENAKEIIRLVKSRGIPYISLWALSDDNIASRSEEEITYLFDLLTQGILDIANEALKNHARIRVIGDRTLIREDCRKNIEKAERLTEQETELTVVIAIAYGGQEEIIRAIRSASDDEIDMGSLDVQTLSRYIESSLFPPPDLIVRSGGHMRHSGFLLFFSAYAEYYFSEKNWPDFDMDELDRCIESYHTRERKFGK